ncbi:MAG: hypothetical protein B6I17_02655 [Tenericutes bacterium 4572_104]|nr:MAG: hypothetical protein B6I17_02655 [Tenericutes bacterium 4572_104]
MKRILILIAIVVTTLVGFSLNMILSQPLKAATYTTLATVTEYETEYNGNYYVYTDYEDLVNQIYQDIYNEVFLDLKAQILSELTDSFYNEIYDSVQDRLSDVLSQDDITVYLSELENKIHEVVSVGEHSVFGVTSITPDSGDVGSGVVYKYDSITQEYYLLTNYHVVSNYVFYETNYPDELDSLTLDIRFSDGSNVPATILGYDTEVDLAILKFSGQGLEGITPVVLADIDDVSTGDFVYAIGNPNGYDFYNSITSGILSGKNRKIDDNRFVDYIQHDAAINAGNSGGALLNLNGELVGINVSKLVTIDIEGMGFAIQVDMIKRVIERIEAGDLSQHTIMPRLGADFYYVNTLAYDGKIVLPTITIQNNNYSDFEITLPDDVDSGIIIKSLDQTGTLSGNLEVPDLIVKIDDYTIKDRNDFLEYLYSNYESGDAITIYYYEYQVQHHNYSTNLMSKTLILL